MTAIGSSNKKADPNAVAPAGPASDPTPQLKEGITPIMSDQPQSVSPFVEPKDIAYDVTPASYLIGGKHVLFGTGNLDNTDVGVIELSIGGASVIAQPSEFLHLAQNIVAFAEFHSQLMDGTAAEAITTAPVADINSVTDGTTVMSSVVGAPSYEASSLTLAGGAELSLCVTDEGEEKSKSYIVIGGHGHEVSDDDCRALVDTLVEFIDDEPTPAAALADRTRSKVFAGEQFEALRLEADGAYISVQVNPAPGDTAVDLIVSTGDWGLTSEQRRDLGAVLTALGGF